MTALELLVECWSVEYDLRTAEATVRAPDDNNLLGLLVLHLLEQFEVILALQKGV